MIRKYTTNDYESIYTLTKGCWSSETTFNKQVKSALYELLTKYYLVESSFNLVLEDSGIKGFLLSAIYPFYPDTNPLIAYPDMEDGTLDKISKYLAYLLENSKRLKRYTTTSDLVIGLFLSEKKGGGTLLLNELVRLARINKIKNIYLWADESCNFNFYIKHNFKIIDEYKVNFFNKEIKTYIFLKEVGKEND